MAEYANRLRKNIPLGQVFPTRMSDCEFTATGHVKLARSQADVAELERRLAEATEVIARGDKADRKVYKMRWEKGADRAVLVSDDGAAGSDLVATSRILAKALERESADLVLFGQQSSDSDGAVLWSAVADRLRRPLVSQVADLGIDEAHGGLRPDDKVCAIYIERCAHYLKAPPPADWNGVWVLAEK